MLDGCPEGAKVFRGAVASRKCQGFDGAPEGFTWSSGGAEVPIAFGGGFGVQGGLGCEGFRAVDSREFPTVPEGFLPEGSRRSPVLKAT